MKTFRFTFSLGLAVKVYYEVFLPVRPTATDPGNGFYCEICRVEADGKRIEVTDEEMALLREEAEMKEYDAMTGSKPD